MQLLVVFNLSYAIMGSSSCICCMQLKISCIQQLHNDNFLLVDVAAIDDICVFVVILQWTTMVNHVTCISTIMIINNVLLRDSLHVNCHSKDDDLEWHIVSYNSIYIITFEDNFFGTTMFTCEFNLDNQYHTTIIFVFQGYAYWGVVPCYVKCTWSVSPLGFFDNGVFKTSLATP
jgi:hypothetical protein